MATTHGTAGRTLRFKLVVIALVMAAAGIPTLIIIHSLSPVLAPLAPAIGLLMVLKLLTNKKVDRKLYAYTRGYIGEARVGRILEKLPDTWRVFNDVDLGSENIDHVVVGRPGVFTIEVKNYSVRTKATAKGFYVYGRRNDKVVRQAQRQAHQLREKLGVEVTPLLVLAGGGLSGDRVGRLMSLTHDELLAHLLSLTEKRLEYAEAREIFRQLAGMTKGGRLA